MGDYTHLGRGIETPDYRARSKKSWPIHTDFSPDNLDMAGVEI